MLLVVLKNSRESDFAGEVVMFVRSNTTTPDFRTAVTTVSGTILPLDVKKEWYDKRPCQYD